MAGVKRDPAFKMKMHLLEKVLRIMNPRVFIALLLVFVAFWEKRAFADDGQAPVWKLRVMNYWIGLERALPEYAVRPMYLEYRNLTWGEFKCNGQIYSVPRAQTFKNVEIGKQYTLPALDHNKAIINGVEVLVKSSDGPMPAQDVIARYQPTIVQLATHGLEGYMSGFKSVKGAAYFHADRIIAQAQQSGRSPYEYLAEVVSCHSYENAPEYTWALNQRLRERGYTDATMIPYVNRKPGEVNIRKVRLAPATCNPCTGKLMAQRSMPLSARVMQNFPVVYNVGYTVDRAANTFQRADAQLGGMLTMAVLAAPDIVEGLTDGISPRPQGNPYRPPGGGEGVGSMLFGNFRSPFEYPLDVPRYWIYMASGGAWCGNPPR